MRNIFKNLNKVGVIAFAAAGLFAISWTTIESKLAPQWYLVEDTGDVPGNAENQEINPTPISEPLGECDFQPGTICAVLLDLDNAPAPSTIAEADSLGYNTSNRKHKQN